MGSCFSSPEGETLGTPTKRTTSQTNIPRPHKAAVKGSEAPEAPRAPKTPGHKLGEATEQQKEDPREAARKAAELRYEQQQHSTKKGALAKKLDEERKRSATSHLKEQSKTQYDEKNTTKLVYD